MSVLKLKDHVLRNTMPKWLKVGFDEVAGQFIEGLELDGSPLLPGIVRTRTIARQIYVFAHAEAIGLAPSGALLKAEQAFDNLLANAWMVDGNFGFASSIHPRTGRVVDSRRQLYDHACVLLALAWLSKATGTERYKKFIRQTTGAIETILRARFGGWAQDEFGTLPRQQNPHMHYFEACLALWETGHGDEYVARAGELFCLFKSRFWDEELGAIREFFGPAWDVSPRFQSERLDPGHMSEWSWLIDRYEKLTDTDLSSYADSLLKTALKIGRVTSAAFLSDEVLSNGSPLTQRRRLWPQVELLKAMIVRGNSIGGDNGTVDDLAASLMVFYLSNAPHDTWRDALNLEGSLASDFIPASSLYHLWSIVPEVSCRWF